MYAIRSINNIEISTLKKKSHRD